MLWMCFSSRSRDNAEMRIMRTILLICFCYFAFVIPVTLANVLDVASVNTDIMLAFYSIYWFQYSINFIIYAYWSKQYKQAYWCIIGKLNFTKIFRRDSLAAKKGTLRRTRIDIMAATNREGTSIKCFEFWSRTDGIVDCFSSSQDRHSLLHQPSYWQQQPGQFSGEKLQSANHV